MNYFYSLCLANSCLILCVLCTNDDNIKKSLAPQILSDIISNGDASDETNSAEKSANDQLTDTHASDETEDQNHRDYHPPTSNVRKASFSEKNDLHDGFIETNDHLASILKSLREENHTALPIDHEKYVLERPWKFQIKDPNLDHPEKLHDAFVDLVTYLRKLFKTKHYSSTSFPSELQKLIPSAKDASKLRNYLRENIPGYFVLSTAVDIGCPLNLAEKLGEKSSHPYYPECLLRYLSILDEHDLMKVGIGLTSFVADFDGSSDQLAKFVCPLSALRLNLPKEPFCTKIVNLLESANVCLQVAHIQSAPEEKVWGQAYGHLFRPSLTCAKVAPRMDIEFNEPASASDNEAYPEGQFIRGLPTLSDAENPQESSPLSTALVQTWNLSQEVLGHIGTTLLHHLYNHPAHKWMATIPLWGFILVDSDFVLRYTVDEAHNPH